jgi:hypothetical protein
LGTVGAVEGIGAASILNAATDQDNRENRHPADCDEPGGLLPMRVGDNRVELRVRLSEVVDRIRANAVRVGAVHTTDVVAQFERLAAPPCCCVERRRARSDEGHKHLAVIDGAVSTVNRFELNRIRCTSNNKHGAARLAGFVEAYMLKLRSSVYVASFEPTSVKPSVSPPAALTAPMTIEPPGR